MKTTEIVNKFLIGFDRENAHFETKILSSVDSSEIINQTKILLEQRTKSTNLIVWIYVIMLIVLFGIFVYFLITALDKSNTLVLVTSSGISVGVFGWIINNLRKIWKEKTLIEILMFSLISKNLSIDEVIRIFETLEDKIKNNS